MKEITFYGRGGQGAVIASEILTEAYFLDGYEVQSFPSFGVERRGAPVTAFLRIAKEPIFIRSQIYQADVGVVLAAGVVQLPQFRASIGKGATLLLNSPEPVAGWEEHDVWYIDATAIALEHGLGSSAQPLVNTAILGAYCKIAGDVRLESLTESVTKKYQLALIKISLPWKRPIIR